MTPTNSRLLNSVFTLALLGGSTAPLHAQMAEVKEKPAMYSYEAFWQVPRAKWAEFEKADPVEDKIFNQALGSGTLVGFGEDVALVHQTDAPTHDSFWSSLSMAGVLDVLAALDKAPSSATLGLATKHSDAIFVSHYYNWKPGTYKGVYTHVSYYKLKPGAPDDAIESMSKTFIAPLMEKLLADGTLVEYEIDEEAIHTESPYGFWVGYLTSTSAGIDKVNAALGQAIKATPFAGSSFDAMVDSEAHRDFLLMSSVTYK